MNTLIYTSEYIPSSEATKRVLHDIVQSAAKNNAEHDITGVLLFRNNHFLQVLEGEAKDIATVFSKIKNDSRHKNIEVLFESPIDKRNYSQWKMELFNVNDPSQFSKPTLQKIKTLYEHNFQFNAKDFIYLLQSLLNDPSFQQELAS